jgi:hypothetical protein
MRKLILVTLLTGVSLGLSLGLTAQVVNVEGVIVEDHAQLGMRNLVLNGSGVRRKYIFDIYVAALYLVTKQSSAAAVLADKGEKRIAMHMVSDLNPGELLYLFKKAIENNNSEEELAALKKPLGEFEDVFYKMGALNKGDVIDMDYLPGTGARVMVNGGLRGMISGDAFYNVLLKIWLGEHPVQEKLKRQLLGGP